jgi:beta-galactosidase
MQKQSFNSGWQFHLGEPAPETWSHPKDAAWSEVELPHDWSIQLPRKASNISATAGGYFEMGLGWYRKTLFAPQEWSGKKIFIEFEGVYMNAEIWVNEHFVLRHPYGYTTFLADLTPYLQLGAENTLKVRVDNSHQLNSRWYSGSGIYRPAWLIVAEPVHLAHWGVAVTTPQVSAQAASVRACWTVQNESKSPQRVSLRGRVAGPDGLAVEVIEADGQVAAGASMELTGEISFEKPTLWSIEHPALYRLESELRAECDLVDSDVISFGIRTLEFSAEKGFLLNGQPVKLKGGCVHHDNGVLGAASYARSEERKVEIHQASGYNAIRTAHNPPAPSFLDACDRLGMLVLDEAFDCWRDAKNIGDYHAAFDDWWARDIDAMVQRDRNHPCVFAWSIGNEVLERDRPEGAQIARCLAERVRQNDSTRPVTSAICGTWSGKDWRDTDAIFAEIDLGGYNYQWKNYEPDHDRLPQRMMMGTESFPLEAYENWDQVEKHNYVLGDFVWTSLDYLGETGIGRTVDEDEKSIFLGTYPWHQANCGDLDLCGFKRPQSFYRDLLWDAGTKLYLAVHDPVPEGRTRKISQWGWPLVWPNWNWAGQEGKTFKVDVYSASAEVELFLNGQSLGRKAASAAEKYTASFEVPYQPGELKAVGYNGGQAAAEATIRTLGPATAVRLSPDRAQLKAAPGDLCYVTVEVVDASGAMHPADDRKVYFTVQGEGSLLAVGSANPISEEDYTGNSRTTFKGRCLAVLKTNGKAGTIRLRAMADGVEPAEVTVLVA